jgi:uncharacterized protein (DUF2267 family)
MTMRLPRFSSSSQIAVLALLHTCHVAGQAQAADLEPVAEDSAPVVELPALPPQAADWQFQATLYGWATALNGEVGVGDLPSVDVDASFLDILKNLDMAAMGSLLAKNDQWMILADLVWADLSAGTVVKPSGLRQRFEELPLAEVLATELSGVIAVRLRDEIGQQELGLLVRERIGAKLADRIAAELPGAIEERLRDRRPELGARFRELVETELAHIIAAELPDKIVERLRNNRQEFGPRDREPIREQIRAKLADIITAELPGKIVARLRDRRSELGARFRERFEAKLADIIAAELPGAIAARLREGNRRQNFARLLPGTDVDVEQSQAIASVIVGYQLPDLHPDVDVSVTAGVRYQRLAAEVEIRPGLLPVSFSRERVEDWADPIVGLSLHYRLTDRWFVDALADVGGFGVGSDLTAQGFAAVGYRWTERFSTSLGYRAIYTDYDKNGFRYDITQHGVYAGLNLHF